MLNGQNRVVFLRGKKVNLRPFKREEIPTLTRWINDPNLRRYLTATFPMTEEKETEWFERIGSDDKNIHFCIELKDGTPIGSMGIHGIDWVHSFAATGALIGEKEYWGKGFGTDAKMLLLDYSFNTLNLRKMCLNVLSFNTRSLKYSLHCGYRIIGRRKRHLFKGGRYYDLIELELFREQWLPIWRKYKKTRKAL